MSDLSKLKEILDNQQQKGIVFQDRNQFGYKIEKTKENILLVIGVSEVGFCFTLGGSLVGIHNLKEQK